VRRKKGVAAAAEFATVAGAVSEAVGLFSLAIEGSCRDFSRSERRVT